MTKDDDEARVQGAQHGDALAGRFVLRALITRLANESPNPEAFRRAIFDEARADLRGVFGPGAPAAFLEGAIQQGDAILQTLLFPTKLGQKH